MASHELPLTDRLGGWLRVAAAPLVVAGVLAVGAGVALAQAPAPAGEGAAEGAAPETAPAEFPLKKPPELSWSFWGPFGKFDQAQLQRGFQVYKEVCSACHSMRLVAIRTLGDRGGPHFPEDQVASLAATFMVQDGPDDKGEMFMRPGKPSDHLPSPFPNTEAAKAANNGAAPPDLSLIAKARLVTRGFPRFILDAFRQYQEGGPDYIHALLTGFQDPPPGVTIPPNTYYNPFFVGAASLSMPPPLQDGQVTYADGSPQTVDQYARDVAAFLMWTAEPHLDARKRLGFQSMTFLIVFAVLMYLTKRRIWSKVHGHGHATEAAG